MAGWQNRSLPFSSLFRIMWAADTSGKGSVLRPSGKFPTSAVTNTRKWLRGDGPHLSYLFVYCVLTALLISGCSHRSEGPPVKSISLEANDFFTQGNYEASLEKYEKAIEKEPEAADRLLFEMGIIYAHPGNERKDYEKALECFRKIVSDFPDSDYRRDSQMLIFQIQNVIIKDQLIAEQREQLDACREGIKTRENEIIALEKRIAVLEQKVFELWTEPVEKVLIEKKERRLTLISKGEAIKSYRIALGKNPVGPKEKLGDNKTPEGNYIIESRNRHSDYHLSLRISYPNEKDKKRAKELGVSPGGDIMIHGVKNGFSWVGEFHTAIDWTEGCIAVTNQEMEEIARLVPNGTPVEIRP